MIRLTTPEHKFTFPMDTSSFSQVVITYKQGDCIVLEKTKDEITFETEVINGVTKYIGRYKLTQEETKKFKPSRYGDRQVNPVEIQVRVLDKNDNAYASNKFTVEVEDVLNTEVLG